MLEIGTSNGYSTLWLAEAVKRLGAGSPPSSWTRANGPWRRPTLSGPGSLPGLSSWRGGRQPVALPADGGLSAHLPRLRAPPLPGLVARIQRLLAPRGLLVVDNAISHEDEMREWMAQVRRDPDFLTSLVPVGKGSGWWCGCRRAGWKTGPWNQKPWCRPQAGHAEQRFRQGPQVAER